VTSPEHERLSEARDRGVPWRAWGPYLSERQWGTVREDTSGDGNAWESFSHDQARSRAYRWGEDGLGGIADDKQRLCFALALWNGRDPILKERLFGLTNGEGNHGEDVKEYYFYLDSTPTHSWMRYLYKYPQAEFPYDDLVRGAYQVAFQERWKSWWRSSGGRVSLGDLGQVLRMLLACHLHLDHLAILKVAQSQATCTSQEQVQHRPAQTEAARLAGEPTDHLRPPPDLLQRALQQLR
jgi:hypothetical protein